MANAGAATVAGFSPLVNSSIDREPTNPETYLATYSEGGRNYRVGIVTGRHGDSGDPTEQFTQIRAENLFTPLGGVILDESLDYLDPRIQAVLPRVINELANSSESNFYQGPLRLAFQTQAPIILADITLRGYPVEEFVKRTSSNPRADLLVGVTALFAAAHASFSLTREKHPTRRQFFQDIASWTAAAAFTLNAKYPVNIARKLGLQPNSETARTLQTLMVDVINPGDADWVMRNIVWALKARDFYSRGIVSPGKILNIVAGGKHRFADFWIKNPEIAKKYWQLFDYKTLAAQYASDDPSWVYKSYVYDPRSEEGTVVEHSSLKTLVEKQ